MTDTVHSRFFRELDSYTLVILMNVVFGTLAMAFGIHYIVSSLTGQAGGHFFSLLRIVIAAFSMAGFGIGLSWIISGVEIMDGLDDIRSACRDRKAPITAEVTTRGIVRMTAHYRRHRKTIRTMTLVCTLGGFCFLVLGILSSIEFFSVSLTSGTITLDSALLIPPALLSLGIAIVSLVSSFYFTRFAKAWDVREGEISRAEQMLANTLDRGSR